MPEGTVCYGVRKLVAINSGKFSYAELDLASPVHLAAPNNRGKSTLVNALQFLYVDELRAMRFGSRTHDDTRRHYFGENPSYLVFECMTPLGSKCLLVVGQGPLNSFQFSRFVFDGPFDMEVFRDDELRLLTLDRLRPRLAGLGLAEVRPGNLWEVLGDPKSSHSGSGLLPRMNILPVRTKEEYHSFREAFIRLLALSNVSARELRELIITCHARDITCRRIDVAGEHREDFDRAEQAERRLRFTEAVQRQIEEGRGLREDIVAMAQQLKAEALAVVPELTLMGRLINGLLEHHEQEKTDRDKQIADLRGKTGDFREDIGTLNAQCDVRRKEWDELHRLHARWSVCTSEMLETMRENVKHLAQNIARLQSDLSQAARLDAGAVRRRLDAIELDLATKRRTLANWTTRAITALREVGLSDDEIDRLFRVLNPQLLNLSIKQDIVIVDTDALRRELGTVLGQIDNGRYLHRAVQIDLTRVAGPNLRGVTNRKDLERDVQVAKEDLERVRQQLEVAENQDGAEKTLREKQSEHARVDQQLHEYDDYIVRWDKRGVIQQALKDLDQQLATVNASINTLNTEITSLHRRQQEMETDRIAAEKMRGQLFEAAEAYRRDEVESSIDALLALPLSDGDGGNGRVTWEELLPRCERLRERLRTMHESLRSISRKQRRVDSIQKEVGERSREFEGQAVYFSEADADWDRLVEMVESIGEQHEAVEQLWDSLFKRVGAKLSEVRHGVSEVRLAVNRINNGLASYRVSNLRGVKLEVVVENDTFGLIETLTSDGGIFQDHEKIGRAKEHMRHWIRDGKVIQLDELFAIHIKVHDMDRERPTDARSLDEIGSTGTGMTAKAMVFIQLVRAVVNEDRYRLHFYLDETGQLDERNLGATTRMAVEKGVMPITADPDVRIESLAHPTVTIYSLGQDKSGKFFIDGLRTCCGRLTAADEPLKQNV